MNDEKEDIQKSTSLDMDKFDDFDCRPAGSKKVIMAIPEYLKNIKKRKKPMAK